MYDLPERVEALLRSHPGPALRVGEIVEILSEQGARGVTATQLRRVLERYPERFRILESNPRWASHPAEARSAPGDRDESAWVVGVEGPREPPHEQRPIHCLRESVRWLGKSVDGRSRLAVSRWYAIALSERAARRAALRRAAEAAEERAA